jgi:hypothetical protein
VWDEKHHNCEDDQSSSSLRGQPVRYVVVISIPLLDPVRSSPFIQFRPDIKRLARLCHGAMAMPRLERHKNLSPTPTSAMNDHGPNAGESPRDEGVECSSTPGAHHHPHHQQDRHIDPTPTPSPTCHAFRPCCCFFHAWPIRPMTAFQGPMMHLGVEAGVSINDERPVSDGEEGSTEYSDPIKSKSSSSTCICHHECPFSTDCICDHEGL